MSSMFEGFADQWTPLLPSRDVPGAPRRVDVAGTPLVTWRTADGKAAILHDRCPHRGVSLALGSVTDRGRLACGFHGWEFEADGRCAHVPFNPSVNLARLGATAPPTVETAGLVWVFTGSVPLGEPSYPDGLDDPTHARVSRVTEWDCHWTRAMEGLLDPTHLPFVHRRTVGHLTKRRQRRESVMHVQVVREDFGLGYLDRIDDNPPGSEIYWHQPNLMMLEALIPPRQLRLYVWCIPIDQNRTRLIEMTTRNFARNPAATLAIDLYNRTMSRQARRVVECLPPSPVPDPHREQHVPTDTPMLSFRSWYLRELADSSIPDSGGPIHPDQR